MKINHHIYLPVIFGAFLLDLTGLTLVQSADALTNLEKIAGGVPVAPGMYPFHCVAERICGCRYVSRAAHHQVLADV